MSDEEIFLCEIGQTAAREMLRILDGNEPTWHEIMLDCTIIERESTLGREKGE